MIIPEKSRWDSLILIGVLVVSILIIVTCIYGLVAKTILMPKKKAEIQYLQSRVEVLQGRITEQDQAIENYQTALKFENLFFLVADPGQVMNFEDLEKYLCHKKEFFKVKK